MWGASEESSGAMEDSAPEAVAHTKETCEQNKNQLESLKEIMMKNQESLKKKEEEVQVMYIQFLLTMFRIISSKIYIRGSVNFSANMNVEFFKLTAERRSITRINVLLKF